MCQKCDDWCKARHDPNWKPKSSFGKIKTGIISIRAYWDNGFKKWGYL